MISMDRFDNSDIPDIQCFGWCHMCYEAIQDRDYESQGICKGCSKAMENEEYEEE